MKRDGGRVRKILDGTRAPEAIAWTFTAAALVLAVLPRVLPGELYDARLAILAATLIAVVWYAYFTHRQAAAALTMARQVERTEAEARVRSLYRLHDLLEALYYSVRQYHAEVIRIAKAAQRNEEPRPVFRPAQLGEAETLAAGLTGAVGESVRSGLAAARRAEAARRDFASTIGRASRVGHFRQELGWALDAIGEARGATAKALKLDVSTRVAMPGSSDGGGPSRSRWILGAGRWRRP